MPSDFFFSGYNHFKTYKEDKYKKKESIINTKRNV